MTLTHKLPLRTRPKSTGPVRPLPILISVDPGVKTCGVAVWKGPTLQKAFLVTRPADGVAERTGADGWWFMARNLWALLDQWAPRDRRTSWADGAPAYHLAIEVPKIYPRSRSKGDPNDLIQVAATVGAIVGSAPVLCRKTAYFPYEWKGTVKKEVMLERIRGRLTAEEVGRLELPKDKKGRGDVLDAVGVGLKYLKRL